jgi:hypothetical protein
MHNLKKVTPAEYTIFCDKYFGDLVIKCPSYRFGQAFYNEFLAYEDQVGNIFNITDTKKAQEIIWHHYIKVEFDYEE